MAMTFDEEVQKIKQMASELGATSTEFIVLPAEKPESDVDED